MPVTKPPRHILAVVDPTADSQPAAERAAALARQYRAELTLFCSCYYSYLTDIADDFESAARSFGAAAVADAERRLEALARNLEAGGLRVNCRAEWQPSRHGSIVAEAKRIRAGLIVKDTHYHSAISRALFTNTDWSLIRETPVPLWLVKPWQLPVERPRIIASVDLATDGDTDEAILQAGKELARVLNGRLYLFHAFDPMPVIGDAGTSGAYRPGMPVERLRDELRARRAEALAALAGRHGIAPQHRLFKSGAVPAVLPVVAEELGAALAVLGVNAGRGDRHATIGSTAEAVMDQLPCDLLVMPAGGGVLP